MYYSRKLFGSKTLGATDIEHTELAEAAGHRDDLGYKIEWAKVDSLRVWERRIDALAERSRKAGDKEMESSARRIQLFAMQQLGEIARDLGPDEWLAMCRRDRAILTSLDPVNPKNHAARRAA